jgi:hypothetical protein
MNDTANNTGIASSRRFRMKTIIGFELPSHRRTISAQDKHVAEGSWPVVPATALQGRASRSVI